MKIRFTRRTSLLPGARRRNEINPDVPGAQAGISFDDADKFHRHMHQHIGNTLL